MKTYDTFSCEITMTHMKIIHGRRRELEYQLLTALFTPGGDATAEALKQRLAPRGKDQIRAMGATPSREASPLTPNSSTTKPEQADD